MGLTRDQRLKWQLYDDGAPDDEVWLNTSPGTGRSFRYHDDLTCYQVADAEQYRATSRAEAQRAWKAPCRQCVVPLDHPPGGWPDDPADIPDDVDLTPVAETAADRKEAD